jgi:hypothetical protein
MSYIVNKSNGSLVTVVEDAAINNDTSIGLLGRGVTSYGEVMAENLVKIMENFANESLSPPLTPLAGQLWWNTDTSTLRAFDGSNWVVPVSTDFYSTLNNTTGTASITITNDTGITIGSTAAASLAVQGGQVVLGVSLTPGNKVTAISVNPATARVSVTQAPVDALDVATKGYVDTISRISNSNNEVTVQSSSVKVVVAAQDKIIITSTATDILGPVFADTPALADSSRQLATTAYVQAQKIAPVFTGVPSAPTASVSTNTTQLATTAFVQANKNNTVLSGVPTAATAQPATDTNQLATTAFANMAVVTVGAPIFAARMDAILTGVPTANTAAPNTVTSQLATTAYVHQTFGDFMNAPYAPKASPQLTGIPTAPTANDNTNNQQIASTGFVQTALSQRLVSYLPKVNPAMQGIPTAPTAAISINTGQVATTLHVTEKANALIAQALANYQNLIITYGTNTALTYTNIIGNFSNGANFFDVYPPSGKSMSSLAGFLPSIAVIHFNGGVNADDSMRCVWSNLGDRIRVYVQNTEQRSNPAANWVAFWK